MQLTLFWYQKIVRCMCMCMRLQMKAAVSASLLRRMRSVIRNQRPDHLTHCAESALMGFLLKKHALLGGHPCTDDIILIHAFFPGVGGIVSMLSIPCQDVSAPFLYKAAAMPVKRCTAQTCRLSDQPHRFSLFSAADPSSAFAMTYYVHRNRMQNVYAPQSLFLRSSFLSSLQRLHC